MFKAAWEKYYAGMIEYVPQFKAVDADAAANKVIFEFGEEETADVVNLVPPMRAGRVAADSGLITANNRWCEVDFLTFESLAVPGRSEEHTSELQSLMRISYAVFCLNKKKNNKQ